MPAVFTVMPTVDPIGMIGVIDIDTAYELIDFIQAAGIGGCQDKSPVLFQHPLDLA